LSQASSIKQIWSTIKTLIKNKKRFPNPSHFINGGISTSDPQVIADGFHNYFVNIGPSLASQIPLVTTQFTSFLTQTYHDSFMMMPVTPGEIIIESKMLKNKSSAGFDNVVTHIMKQSMKCVAEPLVCIINSSFELGIIPDLLKIAKVCPIFKAGSKKEFSNYRPISILPSFSQMYEKLVYDRLSNCINKLHILSPNQYGFRGQHSTYMALLDLFDKVSESLDAKKVCIGIFIDLQKAFDTIDHSILIIKLEHYGVRGVALEWFKSYLSNRKQYV